MAVRREERRVEQRRHEDNLAVEGPFGVKATAHGANVMIALLICVCFSGAIFLGWIHHTESLSEMREVTKTLNEIKYVLSLPEAKRGDLDITKPESLRKRRRSLDD